MIAYILFVLFVLIGLFFLNKKNKLISYFIFGLSIILLYSLRASSVGTDTENYIDIFYGSSNLDLYGNIEPFFSFFNYVLYNINNEVIFYFFFISLIFFIIWFVNIDRLNYFHKDISWLILLTSSSFLSLFNITRQSLAIALSVFAFSYLIRGSNILFLLITLIAVFTHYSAIFIFFVFLFLRKLDNPLFYLLISFIFALFFSLGALDYISGVSLKYSAYGEVSSEGVTGIMLIILVSLKLILFYTLYFCHFYKDLIYRKYLSLFSVGFSLLIVLKFFGFPDEGPLRLVTYFLVFDIFLFPYLFYAINNSQLRVIFKILFYCFMLFSFFYTIYSGAGGLYPYVFNESFDMF